MTNTISTLNTKQIKISYHTVGAFGLRPSHFAFLKVMLASASAWWKNRRAPRAIPVPVAVTEEKNGKAKKNKKAMSTQSVAERGNIPGNHGKM